MNSECDERPWEPQPIAAERFHQEAEEGEWANINRAPYDELSGVIYKRAMNVKRVRYEPADAAPEMPEPWQGRGPVIVRWLFSEQAGTEEGLLAGAAFEFLHDTTLPPGSATGQRSHPGLDEIFYVVAGAGYFYHRPTDGSPVVTRPLRPGDAVLVRGGAYHNVANEDGTEDLRLIVLGLRSSCPPQGGER